MPTPPLPPPLTPTQLADRVTLTVPEVAATLGLHRDTAYTYTRNGTIPTTRIGARVYVPAQWLRDRVAQPDDGL